MGYAVSLTVFGRKCWEYHFTHAAEMCEFIDKWYTDMPMDWFLTVRTTIYEE